ncbi:MAG: nitroreductase family protein [Actinobacteria bacterium]|nr:nitroreductase family protein [Actinomycetota bacterium]
MPLAEAIETQRAIRRLRADPVDDETVLRCIELAMKAPTAGNRQSWEWVVVRDPDVKHQLARLNRQAWSVAKRTGRREPHPLSADRMREAVQWQADHFEETPVIVVACLRGSRPLLPMASARFGASIYPAVQNLLLAARGLGLGATITTLSLWSTGLVRRTLGLPRWVTPCAVIPLGWPLGHYGPTTRRPAAEVVHLDRFGNRPFIRHAGGSSPARDPLSSAQ